MTDQLRWHPCGRVGRVLIVMLTLGQLMYAGGPRYIAGTNYFDPQVKGTPLSWQNGIISYYTDQGDLSPILPAHDADLFVADRLAAGRQFRLLRSWRLKTAIWPRMSAALTSPSAMA